MLWSIPSDCRWRIGLNGAVSAALHVEDDACCWPRLDAGERTDSLVDHGPLLPCQKNLRARIPRDSIDRRIIR